MLSVYRGDPGHCYVTAPLSVEERNRIRKTHAPFLSISKGADSDVLDDPSLFHGVHGAGLSTDHNNERYLHALAVRHFDLQSLTISQASALSDEAVKELKRFRKLDFLNLDCPVAHPQLLKESLPGGLEELRIADVWELPALPKLQELQISHCRLDGNFFTSLHAPRLRRLEINSVDVPQDSFKNISQLDSLRQLYISESNVDDSELKYLQALPYLETSILLDLAYSQRLCDRAEQSYGKRDFRKAVEEYNAVAFSQPSVHLYLQLARCYIGLGNSESALKYCEYAATMDSNNSDISAVRSEAEQLAKQKSE